MTNFCYKYMLIKTISFEIKEEIAAVEMYLPLTVTRDQFTGNFSYLQTAIMLTWSH